MHKTIDRDRKEDLTDMVGEGVIEIVFQNDRVNEVQDHKIDDKDSSTVAISLAETWLYQPLAKEYFASYQLADAKKWEET